jgi:hypothetical protein
MEYGFIDDAEIGIERRSILSFKHCIIFYIPIRKETRKQDDFSIFNLSIKCWLSGQ